MQASFPRSRAFLITLYQGKLGLAKVTIFKNFEPETVDFAQTLLMIHEDMTTFDLYELVYFHVKDFLLPSSPWRGKDAALWWR